MKHLFLFETFIEFKKERQSKKETPKNTHLIYSDEEMTIKVVKTLDSSRAVSDPQWCSTRAEGFYKHNLTSNMYRFIFKDGYKLRLTWDYFDWDQSYSGGTHWGQGGSINGEEASYTTIRPKDESNPFNFDYNKGNDKQFMVNRIKSIPKEAIDDIYKYQELHKKEKLALFNSLYKEIEKIKIIGFEQCKERSYLYEISAKYDGRIYKFKMTSGFSLWSLGSEFRKDFKNKYALSEIITLKKFIIDKTIEWLKSNKKELYLKIKYNKDTDSEDSPF